MYSVSFTTHFHLELTSIMFTNILIKVYMQHPYHCVESISDSLLYAVRFGAQVLGLVVSRSKPRLTDGLYSSGANNLLPPSHPSHPILYTSEREREREMFTNMDKHVDTYMFTLKNKLIDTQTYIVIKIYSHTKI